MDPHSSNPYCSRTNWFYNSNMYSERRMIKKMMYTYRIPWDIVKNHADIYFQRQKGSGENMIQNNDLDSVK